MYEYVLYLIVAVLAGLTWTMSGYLSNWRKNHDKVDWEGFDYKKMRADVLLGLVLGTAVVLIQPISAAFGSPYDIPVITDFASFIGGIFTVFPIVALVDKYILGFIANK